MLVLYACLSVPLTQDHSIFVHLIYLVPFLILYVEARNKLHSLLESVVLRSCWEQSLFMGEKDQESTLSNGAKVMFGRPSYHYSSSFHK